jgi:2-polyprenyl-6-hydroxyphenyl methylase/3-demethylubiquinone-9 3-methyltransferase
MLQKDSKRIPELMNRWLTYKTQRGMDLFADIRDWLGGWPMEYAGDQETVDFLLPHGFQLTNVATGQACSEFLFRRVGEGARRIIVKDLVASLKDQEEATTAA